jgi:hypothetical protein
MTNLQYFIMLPSTETGEITNGDRPHKSYKNTIIQSRTITDRWTHEQPKQDKYGPLDIVKMKKKNSFCDKISRKLPLVSPHS